MMSPKANTRPTKKKIAEFCEKHHIRKLSFFGSVIRGDIAAESDVDVLVEFDSAHIPGLIRLAGMEIELSRILGRKADLRTAQDLIPYFREEVVRSAEVQYHEG